MPSGHVEAIAPSASRCGPTPLVERARRGGHRGPARLAAVVGSIVMAVSGCGREGSADRSDASTEAPRGQQPTARQAPASAPPARAVRFRATDGLTLRGRLVPGEGSRPPAVVLVHESNGGPGQFKTFLRYAHEKGFASLTYRSRPLPGRMDEAENARDIAGAVRALRRRADIDRARIAVVGASIGATSAAYLASTVPGRAVRATVGLSPGTFLDDGPPRRSPHDVLLIADEAEQSAAKFLAAAAPGITTRVAPLDGHGVALLEDARVRADVLEWLTTRLSPN